MTSGRYHGSFTVRGMFGTQLSQKWREREPQMDERGHPFRALGAKATRSSVRVQISNEPKSRVYCRQAHHIGGKGVGFTWRSGLAQKNTIIHIRDEICWTGTVVN